MTTATAVVQQAYAAYGSGDMVALLNLVADPVDWEFAGSAPLPYAGKRNTPQQVGEFFSALHQADDMQVFEPREFIEAGGHVTVLGWGDATVRESGRKFQSHWAHVFTVANGKIVRWRGFSDTAARVGG